MYLSMYLSLGLDLAAQIIQQGRDHGIPGYSEWRSLCNLPAVNSYDDLHTVMSNSVIEKLKLVYKVRNLYHKVSRFCDSIIYMVSRFCD